MRESPNLTPENEARLLAVFSQARGRLNRLATELVGAAAAPAAVDAAEREFAAMLPEIAYRDKPDHRHAGDLMGAAANLALFRAVKAQNINAHQFGAAMLKRMHMALELQAKEAQDQGAKPQQPDPDAAQKFVDAMQESQRSAQPGEFVYEYLPDQSNMATGDWAFNITSCAICHHFRKYDAMDLVPYMCASDDVMADAQGRGLVRSGTIALGAKHCDFRYQAGGTPKSVAEQYPDHIRLVNADEQLQ